MTTKPTVLLLEDTRSEREQLRELLNGLGLAVTATESPAMARRLVMRGADLDLAVIDWDMAHANEDEPTSRRVLEALAENARGTPTVVYARNMMRTAVVDAVMHAHPGALIHDKDQGLSSLEERLVGLLSAQVGDLVLDNRQRSFVHHLPSDTRFKHRAGFRLMTSHPHDVVFPRDDRAMQSGLTRFRQWLDEVESSVRVLSLGMATHRYRLEVTENRRAHHH
ncbi:MAG: hypothetical protein JF886_14215 [Candidatus Dormibacteraeota bacterium]|uniref:Response regulatory domain-containing protein n=1 Tax=Candidatus Aeolococcus gillhamiae TaxID=3127015 RepID=A0A934N6K3_9BACT|nr:hypothetical protein [Candidatus Dormibacteraeota bacterium]